MQGGPIHGSDNKHQAGPMKGFTGSINKHQGSPKNDFTYLIIIINTRVVPCMASLHGSINKHWAQGRPTDCFDHESIFLLCTYKTKCLLTRLRGLVNVCKRVVPLCRAESFCRYGSPYLLIMQSCCHRVNAVNPIPQCLADRR